MTELTLAACKGVREPLWDAIVHGEDEGAQASRHARALAFCRICPVRAACAAEIDLKHDDGIRGGIVLPTIRDSARGSWLTYQPGRSRLGELVAS